MSTPLSARERILEAASNLFYVEGIHAVGVDAIAQAAGVAKTTLYYHFPSKDNLVLAYLDQHDEFFWHWFNAAISQHPNEPREQLLDIFRALAQQITQMRCQGCPFLNVVAEFADQHATTHQRAMLHKRHIHARLAQLAQRARLKDAETLAEQLLLLMDGSYAARRLYGPQHSMSCVVEAAEVLIRAAATIEV